MNITEVRNVIRQVIAEAMEKGTMEKSGGTLVELKKELASLEKMLTQIKQIFHLMLVGLLLNLSLC